MADIDRDYTDRNRTERERVYAVNSGGSTGWWIGGVLVLAEHDVAARARRRNQWKPDL